MQSLFAGPETIHATVGQDSVWFMRGGVAIRQFRLPVEDFLASRFCQGVRDLRVFALPCNAGLIAAAFVVGQSQGFTVHLASPVLLETRRMRKNHEQVLKKSACMCLPECGQVRASVGGWHQMRAGEQPIYAAAAAMLQGAHDDALIKILEGQSIWHRVGFVTPSNPGAVARVIASLRDPRWFVDLAKPNNLGKFYTYAGVGARLTDPMCGERRDIAMAAWRTQEKVKSEVSRHPRGFLWRHFYQSEGLATVKEQRTTRLFLRFLRGVWLDLLAAESGFVGISDGGLFVPEYFFEAALTIPKIVGSVTKLEKDKNAPQIASAYRDYVTCGAGNSVAA